MVSSTAALSVALASSSSPSSSASKIVMNRIAMFRITSTSREKCPTMLAPASPSCRRSFGTIPNQLPTPTVRSGTRSTLRHRSQRTPIIHPPIFHTSHQHYSTLPNQDQVLQSFATPFGQFVQILSRIARILVFTGVGVAVVGVCAFEGTHVYVEKVALKRDAAGKGLLNTSTNDPWGWSSESEEENWGPAAGGSDPRLGFWGRHALRSAWMATHWGSGVAPSLLLDSEGTRGGGYGNRSGPNPGLAAFSAGKNDGLASAEQYLAACLQIAEDKGIQLPDIAALKAGLKNPHQSGADAPLDQTALMLETRLAACRERLGTRTTLPLAIAGYERIYDALAAADATHAAVGHSGQPIVTNSRLVRLATKLGDLNTELGRREEAEAWLLKAITLAGQGSQAPTSKSSILEEVANVAVIDSGVSSTSSKGWFSGWGHSARRSLPPITSEPTASAPTAAPQTTVTPTPALTRALVSTLLSISGLYASPPAPGLTDPRDATWRANLEQALRIQSSALRLIRLELNRVESQAKAIADQSSQSSRELHSLWLKNHEAVVSLHLAETIYALDRSGSGAAETVRAALSKVTGGSKGGGKYAQSIQWLLEADFTAQSVRSSLLTNKASSAKGAAAPQKSAGRGSEAQGWEINMEDLKEEWKAKAALRIPAERLLRNSGRVTSEAKAMVQALDRMAGGQGDGK